MRYRFEVEGDYYEDGINLRIHTHASEMYAALHEIDQTARARLKYGEGVSDAEEKTLEQIRELANIRGLSE